MRAPLATALLLAACSGTAAPTTGPTTPEPVISATSELSPVLDVLAWLPGDWKNDDGSEHWIAAAGAIYGVALQANGMFEVMIIDDGNGPGPADGAVRLIAMPGGTRRVEFTASALTTKSARFDNPAHDAPKNITYARTDDGLTAVLDIDGNRRINFAWVETTRAAAPELEAADRAFAADTAAKGVDGLMPWFAADGWILDKAGTPLRGVDLRTGWTQRLASGSLTWAPVASGRSGSLGFTIGKGAYTGKDPADSMGTTYVTIWKLQPDGTWKVLFDTGRAVNAT